MPKHKTSTVIHLDLNEDAHIRVHREGGCAEVLIETEDVEIVLGASDPDRMDLIAACAREAAHQMRLVVRGAA